MQFNYLFFLVLLIFACNLAPQTSESNFDWLLGDWKRLNEEAPKSTFEHWKKESETRYLGFSYTLENTDTIWQENVQLVKTNDTWSLNITGQGETEATKFRLTEIQDKGFIAENPDNEFPKLIGYRSDSDQLKARIAAGDMEIPFEFERIK